jgi:Tfp pilus tip-associated adhesin PilY1
MKLENNILVTVIVFLLVAANVSAAPTVSSSTPSNGATNIAVTTTAAVTFNSIMKASSVTTSSFFIMDPYSNQVATNSPVPSNSSTSPKTFTITPNSSLSKCVTYNIHVTPTVQDSGGTARGGTSDWIASFTTATTTTKPAVSSTVPANGATGVVESLPISVTFSQLLDDSTIGPTVPTTFTLTKTSDGTPVAGITTLSSFNNVTTLTFTPSNSLASLTSYTATITSAAKNYCGGALAKSTWSFTTRDFAAPYITSTTPASNSSEIALNTLIIVNFSEAMQAVTSSNISVTSGATTVAGTVAFDTTSNMTATFTPSAPLLNNALYTVTVKDARDVGGGNTMSPNPTSFSFTTTANVSGRYCSIPPFVTNSTTPNILMIMDNSQSMDEDFNGAAVGSFATASKSVSGKKGLQMVVNKYVNLLRMGLMTYNQSSAQKQYLSNSPYFVSYEPKSWCPSPPAECFDYCSTGNTTSQAACRTTCQAQNPVFDETYMDEAITVRTAPNPLRTKYCNLVYPKTNRMFNPSDPTRYVYYKQSLPYYTGSNPGNQFDYAQTYTPTQEITNTTTQTDTYNYCSTKTGTNDTWANYGSCGSTRFTLTDSDLANGYGNIGRRASSVPIGRTWFANSSPGGGVLQVAVNSNDTVNTQKNLLINKLATYEGNETGYMDTCTNTSNPNACGYIVNAGLTPTAGTLQTAMNYFAGNTTPIQYRCQKNFIIYVTDGLPSVNESGGTGNATALIGTDTNPAAGTVLNKLDALRAVTAVVGGANYSFDVKTYILGLGLSVDDKAKLDLMASHGGTKQAYYADNPTQLSDALDKIMIEILQNASSGTAATVANNKSGDRGANIIQALFYPQWPLDNSINWLGEVQALWYYLDPVIGNSNILEDTDNNKELDLTIDNPPGSDPFSTHALWKAGVELQKLAATDRKIFTLLDSTTPVTDTTNAFVDTNFSILRPLLNSAALSDDDAKTLINYIRGIDSGSYRPRKVDYGAVTSKEWKLGDVVNSTPQIQSSTPINSYNTAYADLSYANFIKTPAYKARNMVYAGANDGMLHAFKLGMVQKITDPLNPFHLAKIADTTDLGKEEWAFIPKNALPYLPYFCSSSYCHQYLVDGAPVIVDASINKPPTCTAPNYWDCPTKNPDGTYPDAWRTVLIGSLGFGGASRDNAGNCNETLGHTATDPNHSLPPDLSGNKDCVKSPVSGAGLSSYFALDVTDPLAPKSMWELSDTDLPDADKGLGFTTPGAAIVRINGVPKKNTNGRWFAVLASGPTGSIDSSTRQFMGRSDQNLKLYVVDINGGSTFTRCTSAGQTGCNYWVIDTGINFAFANSLSGAAIDVDRGNSTLAGYYSDDVVYVAYTTALASTDWAATPTPPAARTKYPTAWDKGGVLRLVTNNNSDPFNWHWSHLIKDTGPITTSVAKLQDRTGKKLWVFFGEGRYFFPKDELNTSHRIYGVVDHCYSTDNTMNVVASDNSANCPEVTVSSGDETTDANAASLTPKDKWFINLDGPFTVNASYYGAERLITDVTAAFNGIVFFTTFIPSTDVCLPGGKTSLWAVRYNNGGTAPSGGLKGKVPIQTSNGSAPTLLDLSTVFTERGKRKIGFTLSPYGAPTRGKTTPLLLPRPMKQILNIQER